MKTEESINGQAAQEFLKGLWKENPVFVAVLGMCPALAVTNTAINALAMGLATTFVLVSSSILVSLLRNAIPKQVRITAYIVIIATFVTVIDFLLAAFFPDIHKALGAFIALIVVNCLILGRQESFASKNRVGMAILDAAGMSAGFTFALLCIGIIREILGNGSLFGMSLFGAHFEPWIVMILPPGGFFALGFLLLTFNWALQKRKARSTARTVETERLP
ncbi:MAG: electron transport complex subunit E [Bacteroidota bacterium]|nr:electron transport complex subunit E [Bacteroidota bacterium]MDX5428009.1 electron transport complex subunit E [Bacteroidota bacterium]MDX5448144.1 electron transport complex subunit E [Bacteroidota bacterium]MDX5505850.1 electron transport complex subunit E [Bacteroidota bacterium]